MNIELEKLLVLYDGERFLVVPLLFYQQIHAEIIFILPALVPGIGYKTEWLLGPDIWGTFDDGRKRLAGRCVSYMVRKGELPLRRVTPRYKYPIRYSP
jgi:hypothetical protein